MKKTTVGFLRLRRTEIPFEAISGEMLENRTGDDTMKMFFLNIPLEWFAVSVDNEREGGITSGSFAKKLISFELNEGIWKVEEVRRVIPRMINAMHCMRTTLPYNPTPGGEKEHPLVVIRHNLDNAAEPYFAMIQETLQTYPMIDASDIWMKIGAQPGDKLLNQYELARIDLDRLQQLARPEGASSEQREVDDLCSLLAEKYPTIEVNASVYAHWKVKAATLLNLYISHPTRRQSGLSRTYREIEDLLEGITEDEKREVLPTDERGTDEAVRDRRRFRVPAQFVEEYLASDRFINRKVEPERVMLKSRWLLQGKQELAKYGDLSPVLWKEILSENPVASRKEVLAWITNA